MDTNKYILWCTSWLVIFIGVMTILLHYDITSSPVEDMQHKEIIDSCACKHCDVDCVKDTI